MIKNKKPKDIKGLWCRSDNKFYYLESGIHSIANPLARVQTTLVSRGLIEWSMEGTQLHEEPVKMMTMAEALEKNYETTPVYLNQHVKNQVAAVGGDKPTLSENPWSKKNSD